MGGECSVAGRAAAQRGLRGREQCGGGWGFEHVHMCGSTLPSPTPSQVPTLPTAPTNLGGCGSATSNCHAGYCSSSSRAASGCTGPAAPSAGGCTPSVARCGAQCVKGAPLLSTRGLNES